MTHLTGSKDINRYLKQRFFRELWKFEKPIDAFLPWLSALPPLFLNPLFFFLLNPIPSSTLTHHYFTILQNHHHLLHHRHHNHHSFLSLSKTKLHPDLPFSTTNTTQFLSTPRPSLFSRQLIQPLKPHFLLESLSPTTTNPLFDGYVNLLHLSVRYRDAELAKAFHASILKLQEDTFLGNALIVAYLELGIVSVAHKVFVCLLCLNAVLYTVMISAFAKSNREDKAVELFSFIRSSGIEPNEFSFVAILTACIRVLGLELGFQIHALVIKMGYLDFVFVVNALMGLYVKCGCIDIVLELFDEMPKRDITSWNTVNSCVAREFRYEEGFKLFHDMQ